MSAIRYVILEIACDEDGCDETINSGPGFSLAQVRRQAKAEGWTEGPAGSYRDYCPAHVDKAPRKAGGLAQCQRCRHPVVRHERWGEKAEVGELPDSCTDCSDCQTRQRQFDKVASR